MHDTSKNCLLMIEPKSRKKERAVNDGLTKFVEALWKKSKEGKMYKGFHTCRCGEQSDNCDHKVGKYYTNSLCVHYIRDHRSEVPESEIKKIKEMMKAKKEKGKIKTKRRKPKRTGLRTIVSARLTKGR